MNWLLFVLVMLVLNGGYLWLLFGSGSMTEQTTIPEGNDMALKIWQGDNPKADVFLKLEDAGTEGIRVVGVSERGSKLYRGNILRITLSGRLVLSSQCGVHGIATDELGRIQRVE